jgi:hypothetical protein
VLLRYLRPQAHAEVDRLGTTSASLKLKGIDGGPHKQRSVWFNSTQRAEPYPDLTCPCKPVKAGRLRGSGADAAWLSSARVVRCWVKSRNERNPCPVLLCVTGDGRAEARRKAGMTSSPHGSYIWGDTHATMASNSGKRPRKCERILKTGLSADRGLQLAPVKTELLVTAYQPRRREYVPGPCTHRPSRHGSGQCVKSVRQPVRGAAAERRVRDWDEVVTR